MLTVGLVSSDQLYAGALAAAFSNSPEVKDCFMVSESSIAAGSVQADTLVLQATDSMADEIVRALSSLGPLLVLGDGSPDQMVRAVEAGAMGYLNADAPLTSIKDAVTALAKGVATVEPALLGALLRHVVDRQREERRVRTTLEALTAREREVFELLATGLDSGEVADRLFISVQTVRTHTRSLMAKLDLHSRGELIALAARAGLTLTDGEGG